MNQWGTPDWRDSSAYGDTSAWPYAQWRWEFMRRQPDLRAYFDSKCECARAERIAMSSEWTNDTMAAEFKCEIDDPRFTLLDDSESKRRFGYLRLHNPRISMIPSTPCEPPRLSRRLLSVRRSHDERYKEQVLA